VVRELQRAGFEAFALEGGYDAWTALYDVTPKPAPLVAN
jgi:hypothetical protein